MYVIYVSSYSVEINFCMKLHHLFHRLFLDRFARCAFNFIRVFCLEQDSTGRRYNIRDNSHLHEVLSLISDTPAGSLVSFYVPPARTRALDGPGNLPSLCGSRLISKGQSGERERPRSFARR